MARVFLPCESSHLQRLYYCPLDISFFYEFPCTVLWYFLSSTWVDCADALPFVSAVPFCKEKPGCLKVFTSSWTCLWWFRWMTRGLSENCCNYVFQGWKRPLFANVYIANDRAWVTWLESLNLIGWLLNRNIRATSTVKSYLRHEKNINLVNQKKFVLITILFILKCYCIKCFNVLNVYNDY